MTEVERRSRDVGAIAPATFVDWQKMATSFEAMAANTRRTFNVALAAGEPERLRGAVTSSMFFDVLGLVAFVASLLPAMRATRVDPLEALRMN